MKANIIYKRVASFTDAWIETVLYAEMLDLFPVASFTDAWIETSLMILKSYGEKVASFTDAWIETLKRTHKYMIIFCRIFYRCVD